MKDEIMLYTGKIMAKVQTLIDRIDAENDGLSLACVELKNCTGILRDLSDIIDTWMKDNADWANREFNGTDDI